MTPMTTGTEATDTECTHYAADDPPMHDPVGVHTAREACEICAEARWSARRQLRRGEDVTTLDRIYPGRGEDMIRMCEHTCGVQWPFRRCQLTQGWRPEGPLELGLDVQSPNPSHTAEAHAILLLTADRITVQSYGFTGFSPKDEAEADDYIARCTALHFGIARLKRIATQASV